MFTVTINGIIWHVSTSNKLGKKRNQHYNISITGILYAYKKKSDMHILLMTDWLTNKQIVWSSYSNKMIVAQLLLNPKFNYRLNNSPFCPVKSPISLRSTSNILYTGALFCENY